MDVRVFAHRDFHSRNTHVVREHLYLVDFQDSLRAPVYYDLVSFAFDSYLDLKSLREYLFKLLKRRGLILDEKQLYLTALQRNIKALGTFAFQVMVKKNRSYKKYIPRTIRHIMANPLFEKLLEKSLFSRLRI
jgi:aminoglycoside/choline kinase family phosphotransferase